MFNHLMFANSRPNGFPVMEVINGSDHELKLFVPLKLTQMCGEVAGPLASLRAVHSYRYSREECDKALEAVYRFPLPGDAAVISMLVRFGDVEIQTELKERERAQQDYDAAKRHGQQAAVLTRESPDVYTLRIAGLQPDQDVTVTTSYVQLARREGTGWSLRIPLTTAPRYVRGDEINSRHAAGQPLAMARDPGHQFELDVMIHSAESVTCSTHSIETQRNGDWTRVRLTDGSVVPDRDCVFCWQPAGERDRPALRVWTHRDFDDGHTYFLAMVAPPATRDGIQGVAREVIVLVDHSGSMNGAKWEAADWAVERFLRELTGRDRFNLGLFHTTTHWFARDTQPATPETVNEAIAFLKANKNAGGTNLGVALEQALSQHRCWGNYARHVLIITDAQVSDAGRLLQLADRETEQKRRRRISIVCIDAAPNSTLVTELAERGGGLARFLTSQPDQLDITTALDELLMDWAEPVLSGLSLEIERPDVQSADRRILNVGRGWRGIDLGDLPAGRSLSTAGRFPSGNGQTPGFCLRTSNRQKICEAATIEFDKASKTVLGSAIKALVGARRIRDLENLVNGAYRRDELADRLRRLDYDPNELAAAPRISGKIYAENTRMDLQAELRSMLVRESILFGLPCCETALVGVRTEAGQVIERSVVVANALPANWSPRFVTVGANAMMSPPALGRTWRATGSDFAESFAAAHNQFVPTFVAPPVAGEQPARNCATVYFGVPNITNGEATLFDSLRDVGKIPNHVCLREVAVQFPNGPGSPTDLPGDIYLAIFVDDMSTAQARIRLTDIVRMGGRRPLNIQLRPGQLVRLLLIANEINWGDRAIMLTLSW